MNLEKTCLSYDPDDASPWNWNLREGQFNSVFEDWEEFLKNLVGNGPQN